MHRISKAANHVHEPSGSSGGGFASRSRRGRRSAGGFTLVEILVALVIVASLSALAFHGLAGAKAAANRAKCVSNMRQLGMGVLAHAAENHGRMPGTQHTLEDGSTASWIFALEQYLGEVDELRICPADPKGAERAKNKGSSYVLNDYLDGGALDPFGNPIPGRGSLYSIDNPAETMMMFIIAESRGTGAANDHVHAAGWSSWGRVLADIQPDRHRRGEAAPDHSRGAANYLYADGRVETIEASRVKALIESGRNIAIPRDGS